MRKAAFVATVCLSAAVSGRAQSSPDHVGTLERLAVPGRMATSIVIAPASDDARAKLGKVAAATEIVWTGDLTVGAGKQPIFVIQAADGSLAIATDLDRNGAIESKERVAMVAKDAPGFVSGAPAALLTTTIRIATPGAVFPDFPMSFGIGKTALSRPAGGQGAAPPRVYLQTSYQAFAVGSVPIDGKPVRVQLIVNAKDFTVDPAKSYQYVDCDGDGEFDQDMTGWEMGYGRGEPVVFHIPGGPNGDRYVSIKSVDVAAGTITIVSRTAADYQRIELKVGSKLPDFAFKTLGGPERHLSDFRGKYLIIDFWGTWCGPCVGEIPFLKKAYETYKDKGLEILGMDNELPDVTAEDFAKGLEKVKAFVAEKGVTWTQAETESIKPLYEQRFQIVAWPTIILLDPQGTIVSVGRTNRGEAELRGDGLDKTLAAIFKSK